MKHTICCVGDAIHTSDMEPGFRYEPIRSIVEQADTKLFNLEFVLSDDPGYGSSYCGGMWLTAEERYLDDLLKFGFNGCSFANNHTMDYSYEGLFSTLNAVRKRNIPVSGAGKDLPEASDYAVIDTPHGKTALISICSTFNDAARAGNPNSMLPGRPGLNPLRFSTVYHITPEHMKALKEMAEATHIDGRRNRSRKGGYTPYAPEGCFGFGDYVFKESETEGKSSKVHPGDMERTIASIKKALQETDYVVVNTHSHEIKGDTDDQPDDFIVEFSRKCIDAGACAVIGTGSHQLKPIEIYKGKPIFYSIGNFVFQLDDCVSCIPADFGEKYGFPADCTPKQWVDMRTQGGKLGLQTEAANFRSLMPFMTFENGELTEIKCYPLRLNMQTGMPYLADEQERQIILDYLQERSTPYGTKLELHNDYIGVKLT